MSNQVAEGRGYASVTVPIIASLLAGTFSAISNKVMYKVSADGRCGNHAFEKPFWFTFAMFLGEVCCLPLYFIVKKIEAHKKNEMNEPLVAPEDPEAAALHEANQPPKWVFLILSMFDLSATAFLSVALLWVDPSTMQMLRGAMVVFTAIFSVTLMKKTLKRKHWVAVGLVCIGLALVGVSSVLNSKYEADDDSSSAAPTLVVLGVFFSLVGSALNSVQNVAEEKLMKGADVHPLIVVGWEGFWGLICSICVLLPIAYMAPGSDCNSFEDSYDTLLMLGHSGILIGGTIAYALALFVMNFTLMEIALKLSAVHRSLINSCRTVLVWGVDIFIYYVIDTGYGEKWTMFSLIQLGGFFFLIAGTILYGQASAELAAELSGASIDNGVEQSSTLQSINDEDFHKQSK